MNRSILHAMACILATALGAAGATAQAPDDTLAAADTFALEGLVVTATRVPVPDDLVTADVSVVDGDALRASGIDRVQDVLRGITGASVARTGSFGGTTSLYLRGGESDYVQVLVDGVPVNRPGGGFDFGNLTTSNIERIEVVRGPASVLYGSDAMTGVVQLFTRRGRGAPTVTTSVRGGSHGGLGWDAVVRGGRGAADYSFAFSRFRTDGIYPFNNEHRNAVLSGRVVLRPDARTEADLSLRYADHVYHYPTDGAGAVVDRNAFDFGDDLTLALRLRRSLTDRVDARLLVGVSEEDRGTDDRPDGPADTIGFFGYRDLNDVSRHSIDALVDYHPTSTTVLSAGVEVEEQSRRGFNESSSQFGTSTGTFDAERGNIGYYGQALARLADRLSVNVGLRLDDNDTFGTFTTYRAGAAYRLAAGTRVRLAAGSGFKEPTFYESFSTGFVTGNPGLRPETSTSWEAGVEQSLAGGRMALSATYFDQRFEDLIQYTFSPPEPGGPNFFNVAGARSAGVELHASVEPGPGLRLSAGYAYLDAEVTDAGFQTGPDAEFVDGDRMLRRPTHSADASVGYRPGERLSLDLALRYVGERDDRDFSATPARRVVLDPYTRVDLGGEFTVIDGSGGMPELALTLRAENLLDADYREIANFRTPGRTLFVGARVRFGR